MWIFGLHYISVHEATDVYTDSYMAFYINKKHILYHPWMHLGQLC